MTRLGLWPDLHQTTTDDCGRTYFASRWSSEYRYFGDIAAAAGLVLDIYYLHWQEVRRRRKLFGNG